MRPSITKQADAHIINPLQLKKSPRNYNPSICEFNGRTWMAYRSHRVDLDGRCHIAICEMINDVPKSNQWLALGGSTGGEHHEDPRLFVFAGALHVAYSETTFPSGQPYISRMKYARLTLQKSWKVAEVFRPKYGNNLKPASPGTMEKNWPFFESHGKLWAIYSASPHVLIQLVGDEVVDVKKTVGVSWPWGPIRGGTPPIKMPDGKWITFFHSSTGESTGTWRRYWMGAYLFNDNFEVVAVSSQPIAGGSEADDHGHDPRERVSWKPFVVFPGGAVYDGKRFKIAVGVNDWKIAIVNYAFSEADLCAVDAARPSRFFKTQTGQRPIKFNFIDDDPKWFEWNRVAMATGGAPGFAEVSDAYIAEELAMMDGVEEISKDDHAGFLKGKP